jgi:hypothetical protein
VRIVDDENALGAILATQHVDIVLTDVDNLPLVNQHVNSVGSKPAIVPLISRPANGASKEIRSHFPYVMLLSARAVEQLGVISRVMQ